MITIIRFLPQDVVTHWEGELPLVGDQVSLGAKTAAPTTGLEIAGHNNSRATMTVRQVRGRVVERRWGGPGLLSITLADDYLPF